MSEKKKTQLHEILAVEDSLGTTAKNAIDEATTTFSKRVHLFTGFTIEEKPISVDAESGRSDYVPKPKEEKKVTDTVANKLSYVFNTVAKHMDLLLQKEMTNQNATADLVVGGTTVATNVPATALLAFESKLRAIRTMIAHVPTYDESQGWSKAGPHKWAANPEETLVTRKKRVHQIVVPATEHHPAQFDNWDDTVVVGKKVKIVQTGLISPTEKSQLLSRVDVLQRACRKARTRANQQEVDTKIKVGKIITKLILEGSLEDADE